MLLLTGLALFLIFLLLGLGNFVQFVIFSRKQSVITLWDRFWLGFCALIALLQIWHFFLPINAFLLLIVTVLAAFGLTTWLRHSHLNFNRSTIALAPLLLIPLWVLLNHTLFSTPSYDHGLYHLQTVKWFNQYAIVPGLGNLQHRLAFNSSQYLFAAFANTSFLNGYSYYLANVILVAMLLFQSLLAMLAWLRGESVSAFVTYRVLLIPIILWQAGFVPLAGYSADMAVFVLQAVLFGKLLEWINGIHEPLKRKADFRQILILAACGVSIKLSFAVFALIVVVLAIILAKPRSHPGILFPWQFINTVVVFALWLLPWLGRNALLSGFLLFPSDLIRLNLPWRMPNYLVENIQHGITLWARTYSDQIVYTGGLGWFKEWAERFVYEPRTIFMFAPLLLLVVTALMIRKRNPAPHLRAYIWFLAGISLTLLFWFVSGPTYRFSGATIWLWVLTVLLLVFDWLHHTYSASIAWRASLLALLLLLLLLPADLSRNISPALFLRVPPEEVLADRQLPLQQAEIRTSSSGLQVTIAPQEACWDLPLPCTTPNDFVPNLGLIDPDDMSKGFKIYEP